ncbi:hypothetical protein G6F44_013405 [Rhizopus delemar]|nr:hypothetical protein G6F44_013405 [Rhizopus delemar]
MDVLHRSVLRRFSSSGSTGDSRRSEQQQGGQTHGCAVKHGQDELDVLRYTWQHGRIQADLQTWDHATDQDSEG